MNNIKHILIIISLFLLAACGGGSSGGTDGGGGIQPIATVIKGVASKGIIDSGTVNVFALNADGSKGAKLGTSSTDANGAYSISIGSYSGPVMIEVFGSYTDEATGTRMTVPESAPLRAALANVTGAVSLSVTPLTDLAVRQAGTLTAQHIADANALVSDLFKVDITTTAPAAPTSGAFQSSSTTQAQKDYALALAAVSQLMQSGGTDLAATLTSLNSGISSSGMTSQGAASLTAAGSAFINNPKNLTGVTSVADTVLGSVGTTTMKLTLVLQGSAAAAVKGIEAKLSLPAGVTVRADVTGVVLGDVLLPTANSPSGPILGNYSAASSASAATVTIVFPSTGSFAAGDVLILKVDLAPGLAAPTATAFTFRSSKLSDADGVSMSGVTLKLR